MGFFQKKADPISDRSRALNAEIAALESQIKALNSKMQQGQSHPRLRSTALPHGQTVPVAPLAREPIFEEVSHERVKTPAEPETSPALFNDLGVRKYDLAAAWERLLNHFRGPTANKPKLVNFLAAGSIQGLRPLRYEKRVARNRFLALFIGLLLLLLGIVSFFFRHR